MASDKQVEIEQVLTHAMQAGVITRRQFFQSMVTAGLGLGGVAVLAACGAPPQPTAAPPTAAPAAPTAMPPAPTTAPAAGSRVLTPTFYDWIMNLHPSIPNINKAFGDVNAQIAPTQGFDIARFVAEAKNQESTWDVYVGDTPFVEMGDLVKAGVIEPWDAYIPKEVLDDIIPSIREESMYDGKFYSWPFFMDIIVQAYNSDITTKAGIADKAPEDWDEYLANAKIVVDKGAAKYGCTFDAHGWRSLAPITHSISTDVYYMLDGDKSGQPLFDFTNPAAIQALELMKKMLELSSANALQPGSTDGGVNQTPDEVAFASQAVAYYIKYQNAPLRMAATWPNPKALRIGALPKQKGGKGSTVFWDTGAVLFKYGKNKEKAAEYMRALTYNEQLWKDSIGGTSAGHPGQLPPYKSLYEKWNTEKPEWYTSQAWVSTVFGQLPNAKAIPNNPFGLNQFVIGQPIWEKYLKGEVADAKTAMEETKKAVAEAVLKAQ